MKLNCFRTEPEGEGVANACSGEAFGVIDLSNCAGKERDFSESNVLPSAEGRGTERALSFRKGRRGTCKTASFGGEGVGDI